MIEQIQELKGALPFSYEHKENIILASSTVVIDLLFLDEINGLVISNASVFEEGFTPERTQSFCDLEEDNTYVNLKEFGLSDSFIDILLSMARELATTLIGIQITSPTKEMCPSFHVDKLPLRIVQCFNSDGPTLKSNSGNEIITKKNDLIFMKGDMWKSQHGGVIHKSPDTGVPRELIRIDFLN